MVGQNTGQFYFNPLSAEEKIIIFKMLDKDKADVCISLKGKEEGREEFRVVSFDEADQALTIEPVSTDKDFTSQHVGKKVVLKVSSGRFQYFTSGELNLEDNKYIFSVDNDLFQSQQRKKDRLQVNQYVDIRFKVLGEVFKCRDIAPQGISLTIATNVAGMFPVGKEFQRAIISFNNTNLGINKARVASAKTVQSSVDPNLTMVHLGIEFIEFREGDEKKLVMMINDAMRAEEIRRHIR